MQSTPLDQLGTSMEPSADAERVNRIMAEISASNAVTAHPSFSSVPLPQVITEPPLSVSTGQVRMDPGATARTHVIGNTAPTMADFQTLLAQGNGSIAPYHGPVANPPGPLVTSGSKDNSGKVTILQWIRAPLAVAIIVFLLNLPVVTSILSRYASWMYLNSGEISVGGLFVKALLAAGLYATYQGITVFFESSK